jgi:hypothetical protein
MKKGFIFSILLVVIVTILLTSCSKNKPVEPPKSTNNIQTVSKTVYTIIDVPAWLLFPPDGDVAYGIAVDNNSKKNPSLNVAKEFAAVSMSRNHGSFIVDKSALLSLSEQKEIDYKKVDFNVVVSSDTTYLKKAYKEIKPLAETSFHGYKVFIMGKEDYKLNNDIVQVSVSSIPSWCIGQQTHEDEEFVYVIGTSSDANLAMAWKNAQESALRKLAQYRLTNVMGSIQATDNTTQKAMLIETVTRNSNASFVKNWVFHKQVNNASSYSAFIMLKSKKQL